MGSATSFNPLSLSPALWLDASDSTTLFQSNGGSASSADGDPVGYWMDKSGNAKHLTQTSGTNKPLLKLSIQNAKNIVRLDGISSFMNLSVAQTTPSVVYSVCRTNSLQISNRTFLDRSTTAPPYPPAYYFGLSSFNYKPSMYWGAGAHAQTSNTIQRPAIFKFRISSTESAISIDNGTETLEAAGPTVLTTWTKLTETASGPAAFDLCEMLIINGTVSAGNHSLLLSYLNSKWGIY
jgi:hypothetical protein